MKNKRIVNKKLLEQYRSMSCEACHNTYGVYAHHLHTGGMGMKGDDAEYNLLALCILCHIPIFHQKGLEYAINLFPHIEEVLITKGWEFDTYSGKWLHERTT